LLMFAMGMMASIFKIAVILWFLSIQIKGCGDFNIAKFIKMQRELTVRSEVGRGEEVCICFDTAPFHNKG